MATEDEIKEIGLIKGYISTDLQLPVYVDRAAAALSDFVSGANIEHKHTTGMNWDRDATITQIVDIRNVVDGDPSLMVTVSLASSEGLRWVIFSSLGINIQKP